ncbi:MAG: alpha-hydroxy-acid oxidizing protein [Actinomycetia bacterium]|nr:alpha-hydroxy-acid oxidizing protein [Actinomycetes bacterium]
MEPRPANAAADAAPNAVPDDAVSVRDLEDLAQQMLSDRTWNYVACGAADEVSLGWNDSAWRELRLAPRVLVDVSGVDTSTQLLRRRFAHPIVVAPTAAHRQYHPDGEGATRRGAAAAEALAVMSTLGSTPVAELGTAADGPWWFQLYVQSDLDFTARLIDDVVAAGAEALVLTVDTPLLGARDRDRRTSGHTVDGLLPPALAGVPPSVALPPNPRPFERIYNPHLDPSLTWETLEWLVDRSPIPVLAKGVVRADEARRCVDSGVGGIVVSNHGARNLDTVVPTAQALPGVVQAVAGAVPIVVDGGIRRGTDIAKALALGAAAVMVGRPVIWGLTVGGQGGVQWVLDTLWSELAMAMGLLGAPRIDDLTPDLIWQ